VEQWRATNQRMWDERVPFHLASTFYDVEGFKAGRPELLAFEVAELGPLDGLRLLHLQCHFGLDTLDIARLHPTVSVTGLDFSGPAIEAAARLADEVRLADRARFVLSDVYRAGEVLGDERFDVVYTGKGALMWLPDLEQWASVVRNLLAPGGFLYVNEFHPVSMVLGQDVPLPEHDYFATSPEIYQGSGSYAEPDAPTVNNVSCEWQHPIGRVLTALLGAGLQLEFFHEWDYMIHDLHKWLEKGPDGRIRWPAGGGSLPLMYSLKAIRPA